MEKRTTLQVIAGVAAGGTFVTTGVVSVVGFQWVATSVATCKADPPHPLSCHIAKFMAGGCVLVTLILLTTALSCWVYSKPKRR